MNQSPTGDRQVADALRALAASDPDYSAFAAQHPELFEVTTSPASDPTLTRDLVAVLKEVPETAALTTRLEVDSERRAFDGGLVSIPTIVAVAFLLRTRLRVKRDRDGKWDVLIEHKPGDSKFVSQVLERIANYFRGMG